MQSPSSFRGALHEQPKSYMSHCAGCSINIARMANPARSARKMLSTIQQGKKPPELKHVLLSLLMQLKYRRTCSLWSLNANIVLWHSLAIYLQACREAVLFARQFMPEGKEVTEATRRGPSCSLPRWLFRDVWLPASFTELRISNGSSHPLWQTSRSINHGPMQAVFCHFKLQASACLGLVRGQSSPHPSH